MLASLGRWILLLTLVIALPPKVVSTRASNNPVIITTEKISAKTEFAPANDWSGNPVTSADGRKVVFVSAASNLVSDDTNNAADVFLFDRDQDQIERLSISTAGAQGDGWSYQPAISADGHYVVFTSLSTNLDPKIDASQKRARVFLRDLIRNQTSLVSINTQGEPANGWSEWPSISGDGRLIAFTSLANNLTSDENNLAADVFVFDRQSGKIQHISRVDKDHQKLGWSTHPVISADGRYVAYISIRGSSQKNTSSLFVYDRLTGITTDITATSPGSNLQVARYQPKLSADGSTVVFSASGDDHRFSLYLYNKESKKIITIPDSQTENADALSFAITANGHYITYFSPLQKDTWEIRTYDQESAQSILTPIALRAGLYNNDGNQLALSADGSIMAFSGTLMQPKDEFAQSISMVDGNSGVFVNQQKPFERFPAFISGWVSDGMGHPLASVTISDNYGHSATTARDGSFRINGLIPAGYTLRPDKKGYSFSPSTRRISAASSRPGTNGLYFTAVPDGVLEEARKDIGMPYALTRGCPSPNTGCGGPFHGFYSGDCTDLVIDAYKEGAGFNIQQAMNLDFWAHPDHYYNSRVARSSQDMWRYFAYTGQILMHDQPYQAGDIVFFDWDGDGVSDHVSIVSEVNRRGRPTKMIDATGIINDNPNGLAAELTWQAYHDNQVQGHVRWSGTARPKNQTTNKEDSFLLVALDSPQAKLRLLDDQGQAIGNGELQIQNGTYTHIYTGAVITIRSPETSSEWYFIEVSTPGTTAYQLGIQAVNNRTVTKDVSYQRSLSAGETQLIPIKLSQIDGRFTFGNPQLP
jgi:Tol biopolymer transport system component/cell wall-associated NlpC family hydrolase